MFRWLALLGDGSAVIGELRSPEMDVDEDVLDGSGVPMLPPSKISV